MDTPHCPTMTGVKLAIAFGFLLMIVIVCSKQIPEEQHSTYPATDEAHFTNNAHEYHDEELKVNVEERLIPIIYQPQTEKVYFGGWTTRNNKEVWFYSRPTENIASRNQLVNDQKRDLDKFIGKIKEDQVFVAEKRKTLIRNSPDKYFRLDMEGMVTKEGQPHYNLQVQKNRKKNQGKKNQGTSTTYANVLVPLDAADRLLTDKVVRKAFQDSSNDNAEVRLQIREKVVQKKKGRKGYN